MWKQLNEIVLNRIESNWIELNWIGCNVQPIVNSHNSDYIFRNKRFNKSHHNWFLGIHHVRTWIVFKVEFQITKSTFCTQMHRKIHARKSSKSHFELLLYKFDCNCYAWNTWYNQYSTFGNKEMERIEIRRTSFSFHFIFVRTKIDKC